MKEASLVTRAKQSRRVLDSQAASITPRTERTWPLGSPGYPQPQVRHSTIKKIDWVDAYKHIEVRHSTMRKMI